MSQTQAAEAAPALRHGFYRLPDSARSWSVQGSWFQRNGSAVLSGDLSDLAEGAETDDQARELVRTRARRRGWRRVKIDQLKRLRYVFFLGEPTPAAAAALGITAADWLPQRPADFWGW